MDMSKYKGDGNTTDLQAKNYIGKTLRLKIDRVETVTYEAKDDQPEQTKPVLYFVGKERRLVMNIPNTETLCNAFGDNSDEWAGKDISLTTKDYTNKGYGHGWIVTPLDVDFDDDIPF